MKKNLKNKKGFTLIELIVVIGILAVLAMILVPMVSGYMDNAKKSVAEANARSCYSSYVSADTMITSGILPSGSVIKTEAEKLGADSKCVWTPKTDSAAAYVTYTDGGVSARYPKS